MAKIKYDGVLEAVHYLPDGLVDWVRVYERHGPAFSDHVIIKRQSLIERMKSGEIFMIGKRVPLMAGTFNVTTSVNLVEVNSQEFLTAGISQTDRDNLEGLPII